MMNRVFRPVVMALAIAVTAASAGAQSQAATNLTGNWLFSVVTENGTGTPTVVLKQTGDSLSGTYESPRMGMVALKGVVTGKTFTFAFVTQGGTTLTFTGTIEDKDNLKGDVDYDGQGGALFTAARKKGEGAKQ